MEGLVGSNESRCTSFNPANITNITSPSSGSGGTIQYLWQKRSSNGSGGWTSWSTINGQTGLSYNPPTISITTQYRRRARRLPCTQWRTSNVVTKTVNGFPTVNTGANVSICAGETVNLSATASGGNGNYTYTWDNGLGTGATRSFTATAPSAANSVINYTVTVTDGNGCTDTDVVQVKVYSLPEVSVTSTNEYCGQDNGTITFTFTDNANRTGIKFSINNGATYPYSSNDNAGTLTVSNLIAGTYELSVRWGDNSCPVDIGTEVINDLAGPTVIAGNDETICGGESVTITAIGNGGTGGLTYTWDNGLGGGQSKIVYPAITTIYIVTIIDDFGCIDTDAVTVTVLPYTNATCSSCVDPADVDGDGFCASEDCDDNDPTLPAPVGTSCDDGNTFTTNANQGLKISTDYQAVSPQYL